MNGQKKSEKPEVYALRQDGKNWQISRRNFLKAAGIGAAAVGAALDSRFVQPIFAESSLEELCKGAPAHKIEIINLLVSSDRKYLVTMDADNTMKCWDLASYALLKTTTWRFTPQHLSVGMINDKPCIIFTDDSYLCIGELPKMSSTQRIKTGLIYGETILQTLGSRDGSVYLLTYFQSYRIHCMKINKGRITESRKLYSSEEEISSFAVLADGKKILLVMGDHTFRIVNIGDDTAVSMDIPGVKTCDGFAICPDDTALLYPEMSQDSSVRLVSLADISTVWTAKITGSNSNSQDATSCAVTPDGSLGIVLGHESKQVLWLISMTDGSVLKKVDVGAPPDNCYRIAISADGGKCAVASEKSLLFFSLPDLEIIGCPVDLSEMQDDTEGIEISDTDPVSGETVTYTLPCGAEIPAGAVCTCNCVAGSIPSCSCQSYSKPGCSCNSYSSHYWHPN